MSDVKKYYLGLDIGTDSVGYAVTDTEYNLLKFHGEPAWGVTVFDEGKTSAERRKYRTARRRLVRRKQRVQLVKELFAAPISEIDPSFFIRLRGSSLYRSEAGNPYPLFVDPGYTDKEHHRQYPTIHHLICELMTSSEPHDVRLVYLACVWLIKYRGHFLSSLDGNNLSSVRDFRATYEEFLAYFRENGYEDPWGDIDVRSFGDVLKSKKNTTHKRADLLNCLYGGKKPSAEPSDEFPFSKEAIVRLLAGGEVELKALYCDEAYGEYGKVNLKDDTKLEAAMSNIGEDFSIIEALRKLHDWALLVDILGESSTISEAKVKVYEQHKEDLKILRRFARKYLSSEDYNSIFRKLGKENYPAYVYHMDKKNAGPLKKCNIKDFSEFVQKAFKNVKPDETDTAAFDEMQERLEQQTFLPKQRTGDNRVIPYQLYWIELKRILENAQKYLLFLSEKDDSGLTVSDKLMSVFSFRIPYFVGPLNRNSPSAWLDRKAGKIYPWNFKEMVDLDASEQNFIQRMTNTCTYLPGEPVLPKDSLLYHKYMVLNEINNIRINGERISVALKQELYTGLFLEKKKVTRKNLLQFLLANGVLEKGHEDALSGIDNDIHSNLIPQIAFGRLLKSGVLTEIDAEKIIERASYAEDKSRLSGWLEKNYPNVCESDRKYIVGLKLKDFGRLSAKLLNGIEGVRKTTGEVMTVIGALWNTQNNLMEILADPDAYSFSETIKQYRQKYYASNNRSLDSKLDDLYISNAVRRSIYRTLDITADVVKAFGKPEKVFIEVARGGTADQKGKRTQSRKDQILALYQKCRDEDVRHLKEQLAAMGDSADSKLQGDKLFLYYMQLGRSMYSGKAIEFDQLGSSCYNIDHIYPQAYVKDDSVINNKVLVLSTENQEKGDKYPIPENACRKEKMIGFWNALKDRNLISEEKYKRLIRNTPFTPEEKYRFINRQITETSQSTKAVASLLKEKYPETEIVYCKARLVSEFRQEFELLKSRAYNDLHHAVDAYLNIVTGNVYNMKFTKSFNYSSDNYSIKTKTMFTHELVVHGKTVWDGERMLAKVKKTAVKNTAHITKYAYFKKGGFFDQMPVSASKGLVPLKKNLPTEKYGGYNKPSVMFFIPVRYKVGKKSEILIMSVELLHGEHFLADETFAKNYSIRRLQYTLGKTVDDVSFPMGMRPWKVNTMLSLDGFRVCITGSSSYGKCIVAQPMMQFSAGPQWMTYLKRLETFAEKNAKNPNYVYDAEYDKVTLEENLALYDLYLEKLQHSIYAKRINVPLELLKSGRNQFIRLNVKEQSKTLLNIHQVFGRISSGCDLTAIGGGKKAASTVSFSATISNWKKNYKDVRIIDSSASGLWEKKSENLLELL